MKIKNFENWKIEESGRSAISGTELVGHFGPNYGDQKIPNTISRKDTEVIFSELDQKFYTYYDYLDIYKEYLIKGGNILHGFNIQNLEKVISFL